MHIGFFYDFRPVGQGLFSVGRLKRSIDNRPDEQFTWVHDCGSSTLTSTAMTKEIEALRNGETRPNLDLLILSHFDEDHISGLVLLLNIFRVRRLVLPYFTPAERILIVFSQGEQSALLNRFLAGPSSFIRSYQGGQETEILFVRKSGDDPSPDFAVPEGPPDEPDNVPVDAGGVDKPNEKERAADPDLERTSLPHLTLMKDGSVPFTVWGHWEFLFYNLPQPSAKLKDLEVLIQPLLERFYIETKNGENPTPVIQLLKEAYRDVFGSSPAGRNDISLVTYTGPELSNLKAAGIFSVPLNLLYLSAEPWRPPFPHDPHSIFWDIFFHITFETTNPSLLYTGDISLTEERVNKIQGFLTPKRWAAINVLQVPHHGASSSWRPGLAAKFQHRYSVFSSARYHSTYLHPREEVLTDLKDTACVLVNEYTGAVFHGGACWEKPPKGGGAVDFDL